MDSPADRDGGARRVSVDARVEQRQIPSPKKAVNRGRISERARITRKTKITVRSESFRVGHSFSGEPVSRTESNKVTVGGGSCVVLGAFPAGAPGHWRECDPIVPLRS